MTQRGIGRGRGKLNLNPTSPKPQIINNDSQSSKSPINNDPKPLYDQYTAYGRDDTASDEEVEHLIKRGDSPLGSLSLRGGPKAGLGNAPAEIGFYTDLGDRCDVRIDVGSGHKRDQ